MGQVKQIAIEIQNICMDLSKQIEHFNEQYGDEFTKGLISSLTVQIKSHTK